MRRPSNDLLALGLMFLGVGLVSWTALAGAVIADATAYSWYAVAKDWQTLFAAILAIAAAYYAARPVYRQLEENRRQTAAAAVDMIVNAATALEDEIEILEGVRNDMRQLPSLLATYDEDSLHNIYQSWPEQVDQFSRVVVEARIKLQRYVHRNPEAGLLRDSRDAAIVALVGVDDAIWGLVYVMKHDTIGPSYEYGEQDLPGGEGEKRRQKTDAASTEWNQSAEVFALALEVELHRVWKRIRELERVAIG